MVSVGVHGFKAAFGQVFFAVYSMHRKHTTISSISLLFFGWSWCTSMRSRPPKRHPFVGVLGFWVVGVEVLLGFFGKHGMVLLGFLGRLLLGGLMGSSDDFLPNRGTSGKPLTFLEEQATWKHKGDVYYVL